MAGSDDPKGGRKNDDRGVRWNKHARAFGAYVAHKRELKGWKQNRLAEKAGIHPSEMSRLEKGEQPEISAGKLLAVCRALGIDPLRAWYGDDDDGEDEASAAHASRSITPLPESSVKSLAKNKGR